MKKSGFRGTIGMVAVLAVALVFGLALGGCATYGAGFSMMSGEASGEEVPDGLTENEQATGLKQSLASVSVFGSNEYSELSAGNVFGTIERTNTSYSGEVTTEELDISGWAFNYYLKVPIHLFKDRLTIFPMAGFDIHGYGDNGLMTFLKVGGGLDVNFGEAFFLRGRVGYAPLGLTGMTFGLSLGYRTLGDKVRSRYMSDLTGVTTYYVRADGNDKNAGTSEKKPFKTLQRAVEAAAKTSVKKITVIGTIVGNTMIKDADPTRKKLAKMMDATGGQDIAQLLANPTGVLSVQGSLDEPDPEEILITGKPDATGEERAVLVPPANNEGMTLGIVMSTVRLEHIEIGGLNKSGVTVLAGVLTLAQGAKVAKGSGENVSAISALLSSVVIMRDDAEISNNETSGNGADGAGVMLMASVMAMFDNALITGNKTTGNGGGIMLAGASLNMYGNSAISGNSAGNGGGGIIAVPYTEDEDRYNSQITMEDNAVISGNTARMGGGVLLLDKLILRDNAKIIENTATETGGGVWGEGEATVNKGKDAVIANNTAPETPDSNFTFE
ncbi:MAG: hypothetical protein LBK61_00990 [Spirochaetaceae bacterium]|jgi:hypothetical protein|nr:hypothetical protein [Spirochaetaceae bacterium]